MSYNRLVLSCIPFLYFFLFATKSRAGTPNAYITEWTTNNSTIKIPTQGSGYNYDITWTNLTHIGVGNGSASNVSGDDTITGLSNGDTYEIAITGNFPRIYFDNTGDKEKIQKVTQWGDIEWSSMVSAFYGCSNLDLVATDTPDLSQSTSLTRMFDGCSSLDGSSANWNWNTGNITKMSATFRLATNFNGDIGGWDVSQVTSMWDMFSGATSFDQDLGNWEVGKVTNMAYMFYGASSFNKDLNNWDTRNVTNMNSMFKDDTSFNGNIGNWNTNSVINMDQMFFNANSFNQNLSAWNLNSLTNAENMFDAPLGRGMDCENFGQTVHGWRINTNTPTGIILGALHRYLSSSVQVDTSFLQQTKGWTINGIVGPCSPLPISLTNFVAKANPENHTVILIWQTAEEKNSDRFNVLRSRNAKKWKIIDTVMANGTRTEVSNYKFIDKQPFDANYYRLKKIDKDNNATFSIVRKVSFPKTNNLAFTVYPNPSDGRFSIISSEDGTYLISNLYGQVIKKGTLEPYKTKVSLLGLPAGLYFVSVNSKVIKLILKSRIY